MGQCSSTASSEDVGAGFASACQVLLTLTKPVPVVGEVAKVLLEVATKYGEISGTLDEAEQVKAWAFAQARTFKDLEARTSDSSKEIDEVLRGQLEDVARSIGELLKIAEKIKRGCFLTKRIKAGVFQGKFNSAKNAVERARVELDRTLTIKIADTVHRIEETADANSDKLDAILAKIDKNGDTNERQLQRGLVESVKDQPELLTVAEMVVDGDGAGAVKVLAAAPAEVRESAAAKYAEGLALYQQKKWSEAIAALQNCVARDPKNSKAWFALGGAYYGQNGMKNCEAEYEPYTQCIALDPNHYGAHVNLGNMLNNVRKDYDRAEELYRKAIELDPKYPTPLWNLSLILEVQKNDIPGAIKLVEECVRLGRANCEDRLVNLRAAATPAGKSYSEGLARKNEKKWPEAIAALRRCVDLDANHSSAWFELGYAFEQRDGNLSEASYEPYTRCIELEPKHVAAHVNLGNLFRDVRKDYDRAEELYKTSIGLDPKHVQAHTNLGTLLSNDARKDYDGAERMHRKAIELDPEHTPPLWNLSLILEKQKNDIPGAVKQMEEYVRLGGIPGWNDGKERLAKLRAKL